MPRTYKHALLMFSKPPIPGLVKTRLTREKGGIFSEQDAAELFHRSLFDVMELCIRAVEQLEAEDAAAASSADAAAATSDAAAAAALSSAAATRAAPPAAAGGERAATTEAATAAITADSDAAAVATAETATAGPEAVAEPKAARHEYGFFISTTPEDNVARMRETFEAAGEWPREFIYLTDKGANFDEHFDDAFRQVFTAGYDSVLSVGGDIPMLPITHITTAFRWLQHFLETSENGGLVQAPCQECGVSLIGWTRDTPIDHQGVYYNMGGRPALDAYVAKAGEKDVPFASLSPVADIDDVQDLAHAISLARAAAYGAQFQSDLYVPRRFLAYVDWRGLTVGTPPNEDRDSREGIDA
jgi:glycosyltransferase A (GT-A) superfamily protein (DUF2064 family)